MLFLSKEVSLALMAIELMTHCLYLLMNDRYYIVSALSITNVCVGGEFACSSLDNNKIKCWGHEAGWGYHISENIGDSLDEVGDNLPYVDVSSTLTPQNLFCGFDHFCVVFTSGDMKCMGMNDYGQLGLGISTSLVGFASGHTGDSLPVVNVGTGLKVLDVSLSEIYSCIIVTGGYVKCFGGASSGNLGYGNANSIGTSSSQMGDSLAFVDFGTSVTVSSIQTSVSGQHTCAILSTPNASAQRIKCWGNNEYYQLGYGDTKNRGDNSGEMGDNLPLVDLGTESRVTKLSLGRTHTCALLIDEVSLKCWGDGDDGRLGSGSTNDISSTGNSIPVVSIDSGYKIKHISGRLDYVCVVYNDDLTLKCFGDNSYGQLGQGDTVDRGGSSTTTIPYISAIQLGTGSLKISSILVGGLFNCVLFSDFSLKCFGRNYLGQCAIGADHDVGDSGDEMGSNLQYAQLFASTSPTSPTTKTPTKNPTIQYYATQTIASFSTGTKQACAVFSDGKMKCWGSSESLGKIVTNVGDSLNEVGGYLPYINVGTGQTISKVSCGGNHVCLILASGNMKCMGSNEFGQVGMASSVDPIGESTGYVGNSLPTINLGTSLYALSVVTGRLHTCALVTGNKVKCFGRNNYGQLGQGSNTNRGRSSTSMGDNLSYSNLGTSAEASSIHSNAFSDHNCVILSKPSTSSQRFKCWGRGGSYQLGYGSSTNRGDDSNEMGDKLPLVYLGSESRVSQLSLGASFTCALLITNAMKCFGYNSNGALASGSSDDITSTGSSIPTVTVNSGKTIKYVGTGNEHTCIVYDDEVTLKCAGTNTYGQLGQGDTTNRGDSPSSKFSSIPAIDLGTGSLKIKSVYGGEGFTCTLLTDSSVKCFGYNEEGECLVGKAGRIGDSSNEMGGNLQFAMLFSPTQSPTKSPTPPTSPTSSPTPKPSNAPTFIPTKPPSLIPTKKPSKAPTGTPSKKPSRSPTLAPSKIPSDSPTKAPTKIPTKSPHKTPSENQTTTAPSKSPSKKVSTLAPSTIYSQTPTKSPISITDTGVIGIAFGVSITALLIILGGFVYIYRSKNSVANSVRDKISELSKKVQQKLLECFNISFSNSVSHQ